MSLVDVGAFFLVTGLHIALVPVWLHRRWGERFSSREESLFHALVFGLGSLQAVLHGLACTVGIGLYAGIAALVALHLAAFAADVLRPAAGTGTRPSDGPPQTSGRPTSRAGRPWFAVGAALLAAPWPTLAGVGALAAVVISWLWRAPRSMQILGIDARHYHAPHAIHYGQGGNLFGWVATGHLYPAGASLLGAWFFQPFSGPLLIDLVNLLPFLLLFASLAYLFRVLTDQSGFVWAPFVFLLLFTGKLFRVSVFFSADLFYAASFAALFTLLCAAWRRGAVAPYQWWAMALSAGMLVSAKPQGTMSAVLLPGLFAGAGLAGRIVLRRGRCLSDVPWRRLLPLAAVVLLCGGVWLVRNWWCFGSPLAPAGLTLFGVTVFSGQPARSAAAPLSVLKDMRDIPGYDLGARFLFYARDWMGIWPVALLPGLAVLLVEFAWRRVRGAAPDAATRIRAAALAFLAVLFAVHAFVLVGVTFSSLEWLRGQTLRFLLPFFALFPLLLYACLFPRVAPWVRAPWAGRLLLLPGLLYLLSSCNDLTAMPAAWNRSYGREDLLDPRWLPLAVLVVAPWLVAVRPSWRRWGRLGSLALVVLFGVALVRRSVVEGERVLAAERTRFALAVAGFERGVGSATVDDGVLYRAVAHQKRSALGCRRSRFFTLSRFDFPVALQDPDFNNLVFNVENGATRRAELLAADGPGRGPCDYVVAVHVDSTLRGTEYKAIPQAEAERLLGVPGRLEPAGDSGLYRVYHVPPC